MSAIDADDLALLAEGFEAALRGHDAPGEAVAALHDLGWGELLEAAPAPAIAATFRLLGSTGSAASLIDDVACWALGCEVDPGTAVVLPRPGSATPPARRDGDAIHVDGLASSRLVEAGTVIVPVAPSGDEDDSAAGVVFVTLAEGAIGLIHGDAALDPTPSYRQVRATISAPSAAPIAAAGTWDTVVAACRIALARELDGLARAMLELARGHAMDREQFGRPVAMFQALRHKLAESFVQIEGAAAAADVWEPGADPLIATLAKSLAGKAARTTATHAQQVLAGIGFTTEHGFHRLLKRSMVVDQLFGSASTLPAEIGRDLLARGHAPRLVEL
ncbi:MAG: acyl-CoA dehydrogenase family protein [Acidimicrobiales bacterium]